jgi:hypothetical protein
LGDSHDFIVESGNYYFIENATSAKFSFSASMEPLNWFLTGPDADFFEIDDSDNTGSAQTVFIDLKTDFKGNISFENPVDFNQDHVFSFILNVSDVAGNTSSVTINMEVVSSEASLSIDHPDTIVSYNDGPITVEATFAEAQTDSPTLVYTDFGGTTSLTMNTTSGTTDRKHWEYDLFFSGPDEQKQLSVGSSSLTVTFDSM